MEKEKLLDYVAPCSLLCYTCMGFKDGPISQCAKRLYIYNEGVCEFRSTHMLTEKRKEWHSKFNEFHETLLNFSGASCTGCRNDPSSCGGIEGCVVPNCVKEHGVDFCADCNEFPCQKAKDFFATHDDKISKAWETGNRLIKKVGIDAYFTEKKDVSHYIHYKENEKSECCKNEY